MLVDGDCFENASVTLHSKEGGIACTLSGAGVANCLDTSVLATRTTNFFGEFKFDGLDDGEYTLKVDAAGRKYSDDGDRQGRVHEPGLHQTVGSRGRQ